MKAPIHLILIRRGLSRAEELPPAERADLYEAAADLIAAHPDLFGGQAMKPLIQQAAQTAEILRRATSAERLLAQTLKAQEAEA